MQIKKLKAREILDSRGNPTVEVDLYLDDGSFGRAAVPSGASTGQHEAVELRDGDKERYHGKGVLEAIGNIEGKIAPTIKNKGIKSQEDLDNFFVKFDGEDNKSGLGANAILPISMAFAVATAQKYNLPLFKYLSELTGQSPRMPKPMFNILNGGKHANWSTDIQEFMVVPRADMDIDEYIRMGSEIYHALGKLLDKEGYSTNVGNEGGFAPHMESNKQAVEFIMKAIKKAGYKPDEEVGIALDVAASELYKNGKYKLGTEKRELSVEKWRVELDNLAYHFPLMSVEDPFAEDAWDDWVEYTETSRHHNIEQVVGDDLLVTNPKRIRTAIDKQACNALLVKPNQIGTVTETLEAMRVAREADWNLIVSHRSGETEDTFISHLAMGTGAGQIKAGAPSRGERTAKYNELIRMQGKI